VSEDYTFSIKTEIEFAAGTWWVNVYVGDLWAMPVASYGPLEELDYATQVQREIHEQVVQVCRSDIKNKLELITATVEEERGDHRKFERTIEQNWDVYNLNIHSFKEVTDRKRSL